MSQPFELLERRDGQLTRLALTENGVLLEYDQDETAAASMVGAVLVGKVERVLPGVKAAFVKLGLERNGFLPFREQDSFHLAHGNAPLQTDQDVLVQVKKDPKGDKGAFLTRDIALPGQFVLLMPENRFVGVSKRVDGEGDRERARRLGAAIGQNRFGLIVRHAALFVPESEVWDEAEALWEEWRVLKERAACLKAPSLVYQPASITETVLRDYAARHDCTLYTDAHEAGNLPQGVAVRRLSAEEMEAKWKSLKIDSQLCQALERRVPLREGGDLIIDQREALQTIDVNTGSNVTAQPGQSLPLSQNLSAVPEIARQIRLRNLCGIILVDFIDMETAGEREQVLNAMREALRDDRVKTAVHDFTSLGLMEITRKRTRDSLLDALTDVCSRCHGTGRSLRAPEEPSENGREEPRTSGT